MQISHIITYIVILIISVILPEIVHAYVADEQGDPTPRNAGYLSFNPLRHIDIVGSVLFPLILLFTQAGFIIGWAKPTPYNKRNFQNKKYSVAVIAISGILTNFCIALVGSVALRIALFQGYHAPWYIFIVTTITLVNLLLVLFNSIPIPPLSGFKILLAFVPGETDRLESIVEYYSVPLLIIAIIFLWPHIFPVINSIFISFTGLPLSPA